MAKKLDWMKRFLATLLGFILFGFVGILLKIILFPYTKNKPTDVFSQLKARKIVGKTWKIFVDYLKITGVLEVEFEGFERLGKKGQLVVANHPSLLDVVLIFSKENRFNCIVKKELMYNPVMSSPIKACGFIPNIQSEELLQKCHEILQNQALLLFPEGTRTGWDEIVKLNRGSVSIGLRSAKIITPIIIKMNPLNFKKGQPWYKIPARKISYKLIVGEDIDPQEWLAQKPLPIASRQLNIYLENYFNTYSKD